MFTIESTTENTSAKTTESKIEDVDHVNDIDNEYDRSLPNPIMGPPFYLAYQKLHQMVEKEEATRNLNLQGQDNTDDTNIHLI